MKADLTTRYFLLTKDVGRNKQAASKMSEVLGQPISPSFLKGKEDFLFNRYLHYGLELGQSSKFINNFRHRPEDKTPITWEELVAVHEEYKAASLVDTELRSTVVKPIMTKTKKALMAVPYFMAWILYWMITATERQNYAMGKLEGKHCWYSDGNLSGNTYYFDPSRKPVRTYLTWKEFWQSKGYVLKKEK